MKNRRLESVDSSDKRPCQEKTDSWLPHGTKASSRVSRSELGRPQRLQLGLALLSSVSTWIMMAMFPGRFSKLVGTLGNVDKNCSVNETYLFHHVGPSP